MRYSDSQRSVRTGHHHGDAHEIHDWIRMTEGRAGAKRRRPEATGGNAVGSGQQENHGSTLINTDGAGKGPRIRRRQRAMARQATRNTRRKDDGRTSYYCARFYRAADHSAPSSDSHPFVSFRVIRGHFSLSSVPIRADPWLPLPCSGALPASCHAAVCCRSPQKLIIFCGTMTMSPGSSSISLSRNPSSMTTAASTFSSVRLLFLP